MGTAAAAGLARGSPSSLGLHRSRGGWGGLSRGCHSLRRYRCHPGRPEQSSARVPRKREREGLQGGRSPSRTKERGDVSYEFGVDTITGAAAAVDGAPGGRGPGRRATHGVRLRALPARGVGSVDGALCAHTARPLQPHARLVLDRPQGGARTWAVRLCVGVMGNQSGQVLRVIPVEGCHQLGLCSGLCLDALARS